MRLHYKIVGLCVLLCLCFSSRAYSQFGRGGAADMTKTENLLDSLRVAANTMAALTRSNQESSQRMEAMTDQIRYLTWAIAGLTLVQIIFGVLNFRTAKAATTSPKLIRILPRAAHRSGRNIKKRILDTNLGGSNGLGSNSRRSKRA